MKKKPAGVQSDNNNTSGYDWQQINATHHAKCFFSISVIQQTPSGKKKKTKKTMCIIAVLLCVCQMAYVTEIRLSGDRGAWGGVAPSSCPEVDLEVIEEYLQEHSLEVQPAHTPASPPTTMGQQTHTHSHQSTRIIG